MPDAGRDLPTYRDLPAVPGNPPKTAWGLFGDDDNVGMVNLQTPDLVVSAARLVRRGVVFSLNWEQHMPDPPLFGRGPLRHTVIREFPVGGNLGDDFLDGFYPQASSQWDGLAHFGDPEHGFWGGISVSELSASREPRLGIDHWARRGIVGRAVMLDVARHLAEEERALDHRATSPIRRQDLEATIERQGVDIMTGDVILIHTGWVEWYERQSIAVREELSDPDRLRASGLEASEEMAEYLFDLHPSAICGDNPGLEAWPPPDWSPDGALHHWLIGRFGMAVGELFKLGPLAADCASDGTYDSFFTAAPLNIIGGTGSPANALAIK